MNHSNTHLLTTWQWLGVVAVLIGATLTHIGSINTINTRFHADLMELDDRWQVRTEKLSRDIREEIRDVRDSSLPGWLQEIVERNTAAIENLQEQLRQK